MTSFNPLPSQIQTAQADFVDGLTTPSYGGAVETGAEYEFVIDKHGRRRCVLNESLLTPVGPPLDHLTVQTDPPRCKMATHTPVHPIKRPTLPPNLTNRR